MQSRKRKPKAKLKQRPKRHSCRAIILTDGAPVRKKAKKAYEKARGDLDQARHELDRFNSKDKPEFQRWLSQTFGKLLTEIRETGQKLEEKRQLVFEVESEAYYNGISMSQAYRRVMAKRAGPVEPDKESHNERGGKSPDEERGPFDGDGEFEDPFGPGWEDLNEAFESFFEDMFGIPPSSGRRPARDTKAEPDPAALRIKSLYRSVVRRLHPDVQSEMSQQKLEWWHQAQRAYETRDAEQLEMILTLCEIEDSGTTSNASVSLLSRITRQFKITLRSIKRELTKCRRDPAWNFSDAPEMSKIRQKVQRELQSELYGLRNFLSALEAQINAWARAATSQRRKPRQRTAAENHPEFLF